MSRSVGHSIAPGLGRIVSMDQFRGYTVAGMFLVNFLGMYAAIPAVLKHNVTYFSYADSIMPSFMFAAGFSFRLTVLRRLENGGAVPYRRFVARGLGLVLVSLMMYGFGEEFKSWEQVSPASVGHFLARLVKANLWETLSIIGMSQILLLPFIAKGPWVRLATAIGFMATHALLCHWFNFNFVFGRPNWLDSLLTTTGSTAWDGGTFGLLMWGTIMLFGSLAYDLVRPRPGARSAPLLIVWGVLFLALGYGLSCFSVLYDGTAPADGRNTAVSPVIPPFERMEGKTFRELLAEPPMFAIPKPDVRPHNYWQMHKRIVSPTFVIFTTGWALALYGIFVLVLDSDASRSGLGLFRTFGTNALAAYVIHHMVEESIHSIVPKDAPLVVCLVGLAVFFGITYLFVRFLEKQDVYIRL